VTNCSNHRPPIEDPNGQSEEPFVTDQILKCHPDPTLN